MEGYNYPLFKDYLRLEENEDLDTRCIAAADVLISAKDAIETFKERQRSIQLKSLDIFGILQALTAQQDAVNTLYQILLKQITHEDKFSDKIKKSPFWKKEKDLIQIRNIRNDIIGHPSDIRRGRGKEHAVTNIMRIDQNNYIHYASYSIGENDSNESAKSPEYKTADIQKCLKQQDQALLKYLKQTLQSVKDGT